MSAELTTPVKIEIPGIGTIESADLYLKSEADKVIAEKDAKILALDAEVFKQKHHAELFFNERNYAETQLRKQKYKRCLAMAMWCGEKWADIATPYGKSVWYNKWQKRWLSLANKFKEAQ